MNNAILNFPVPANEPVKAYLEGSPERIALDAELERRKGSGNGRGGRDEGP